MKTNTLARSLFLPVIAALALAACDDSSGPSETFAGPTGFALINVSNPIDITPDGNTVVVQDLARQMNGDLYFYDVSTGVRSLKTQVGSPFFDFATGVSEGGRVSALHGEPVVSGAWDQASGWTDIPSYFAEGCDQNRGGAWDISVDGQTMVGFDWNGCTPQAMRYTDVGGTWTTQPLELLGSTFEGSENPPVNRATVVSGNGLVAAGFAQTALVDRWPAVWQANGTGSLLASGVTEDTPGEILSINHDGSVMAGTWGNQGFVWDNGTVAFMESLPPIDPFAGTYPNAIAAGNQLVFGGSGGSAFVWTAAGGMRNLQEIAVENGIDVQGVTLVTVKAASADGTIVVGQAVNASFRSMSFVLKLPASAYGL